MKINNIISGRNKPIVCIEENKIFYSCADAAAYYGVHFSNFSNYFSGKQNTVKGRHFRYAKEDEIMRSVKDVTIQEEAHITANGIRSNGNCEPCVCISDGSVFASMVDAAEYYGFNISQISYACKGVGRTTGGLKFCKMSDLYLHIHEFREAIDKSKSYDILIKKENTRKDLVAEINNWQEEVFEIELKMNEMNKQLEEARASLENARIRLQNFN